VKPENMQLQILNNPAETRIVFDNYDAAGNLLQQGRDKDVREVYLWGYGSQYPVARIVGTDYNTAKQYINQTMLDNAANYTDADIRTELDKLRSNLPGAQVTTYTYTPVLGMTSATEPNGKTQYYEYDNYGRLKLIKDQNGKILKQYDYQYQKPLTQ
jgi:YD repeat-containing protein